eukprot:Clim_evm51s157 gene=Clim_evmTU51s157
MAAEDTHNSPNDGESSIRAQEDWAPVKPEFQKKRWEDAPRGYERTEQILQGEEASVLPVNGKETKHGPATTDGQPPPKKQRRYTEIRRDQMLCPSVVGQRDCSRGDRCQFQHKLEEYLETKQDDLEGECPNLPKDVPDAKACRFGPVCRFAKSHPGGKAALPPPEDHSNKETYPLRQKYEAKVRNTINMETRKALGRRKYEFKVAEDKAFNQQLIEQARARKAAYAATVTEGPEAKSVVNTFEPRARPKLDFRDKTYLAPLTTVGNLPFRVICKRRFKCDITCSEMALGTSLLGGGGSDLALLKRHRCEDMFGVQVCGNNREAMMRCVEMLGREIEADFIDLNLGCPIDQIYKRGLGSGLMAKPSKCISVVEGMCETLHRVRPDMAVTVKMRTGVSSSKPMAAQLVTDLARQTTVALFTLHGRSREQRYLRSADWNYISTVAKAAHTAVPENPVPLFGNGDLISWEEYNEHMSKTGIDGCMLARGALIKPWVFTEIKERRTWDISSSERMDMLRDFVNEGLMHWGSDKKGVELTRRFLLEWLSFLCRYVPVGVMERVPMLIQERPPPFFGRDDLETLMASPSVKDWIRISEMLLGPVPKEFKFVPKHKANAYEKDGSRSAVNDGTDAGKFEWG